MDKISLIHIKVKECHENEETYFLWTSPELEWLLIEAKSIEARLHEWLMRISKHFKKWKKCKISMTIN